jgi:hypothetical protein
VTVESKKTPVLDAVHIFTASIYRDTMHPPRAVQLHPRSMMALEQEVFALGPTYRAFGHFEDGLDSRGDRVRGLLVDGILFYVGQP